MTEVAGPGGPRPPWPLDFAARLSDVLPDGLVIVDGGRIVRMVNQRAGEVLRLPLSDAVGRPVREVVPLSDADGRDWWQVTNPWDGLPTLKGHREKLLWTPAGVEVLATARYLRPGRGMPVDRVVVSLRDSVARERAEQDHAALLSTLAHELRSPLTSVKGFSTTLLRRWDRFTDDQKRLIVETIEADADRVSRLVADLLDVSRIDAGRLQVRRQEIFLDPLIERHRARQANLGLPEERIVVEVQPPVPDTWADPDRVDQILINLVDNALKHGRGTVTVSVRGGTVDLADGAAGDARPAAVVSVADEGDGVPERLRTMIFSRFWHSPGAGNNGLGLYVVRALVEAHGGRIAASDAPGGGALFTFSLPAGDPEATAGAGSSGAEARPPGETLHRRPVGAP